jgi:hypothetical protein
MTMNSFGQLQFKIKSVRQVSHEPGPERAGGGADFCFSAETDSQQVVRIVFWQPNDGFVDGAQRASGAGGVCFGGQIAAVQTGEMRRRGFLVFGRYVLELADVHVLGRLGHHHFDFLTRRDELDIVLVNRQAGLERLRVADLA